MSEGVEAREDPEPMPVARVTRRRGPSPSGRRVAARLPPREGLRSSRLHGRSLDDERSLAPDERADQPLWQRLVEQIRTRPIVGADETRLLMQNDGTGKSKNGFIWTFVAPDEHGEHDVVRR